MNCPQCHTALVMSERQGVEIDYCPQCRGVWLDRGELDKILERSNREMNERPYREDRDDDDRKYAPRPGYDNQRYPHKKKSFWSELFD